MRREAVGLVALLACAACAHVETRVMRLGPPAPPLVAGSFVPVRPPPLGADAAGAREVALLEVTSHGADRAAVIQALQVHARALGANLVLWMREDFIDGFGRVIASAVRTPAAR
ncbi:MAG: hypothetical protein U0325_16320 [Polyangiales bacterium]